MKAKNREMANKFKDAFKKAGIELPTKKDKPVKNKPPNDRKSAKSVQAISLRADQPDHNRQANSKNIIQAKPRNPKIYKRINDGSPSLAAIREAYGSSSTEKSDSNKAKNQEPAQTILKSREGIRFEPNPVFNQKVADTSRIIINEGPCSTQLSLGGDIEVHLVIGLDLGTSTTKVVIGDPDNKRFFAVPFSLESANSYFVPTAIFVDAANNIVISTGDNPEIQRDIKLDLMQEKDCMAIVHLAGYIAQSVRHSMNWFLSTHADDYRGMRLFWTMAMGLPVDSVRQFELENRFRLAAIAGAQAAISQEAINRSNLDRLVKQVEADLANQKATGASSCFEELGGDPGVVVVVPEIAAQVVGLYRSLRWDPEKPISFLMDIGAGTVDSAVFSLVDAMQKDKELAFCTFSCNVSELGVIKLHLERIDWLISNLPEDMPDRQEIIQFLTNLRCLDPASAPVPGKIDDYINHIKIVPGKDNHDPDRKYRHQLGDNVYKGVLLKAKRKNESGGAWSSLRTMICGGGARSAFYRQYVQNITNTSSFNLQVEVLERPNNLEAPGLPSAEYDRLSVAYGLAQGTQWEYRWPEGMEEIGYRKKDASEVFISKDLV